jgi:hypothetical protein
MIHVQVEESKWKKLLGDPGPLNDNQLACIRYAVKHKADIILKHVDNTLAVGGGANKSGDQKVRFLPLRCSALAVV